MSKEKVVVFAVGASGGHIFPALATAEELKLRGVSSVFILGGEKFADKITAQGFPVHVVKALPWNGRGALGKLKALFALSVAVLKSAVLFIKIKPYAVCGTGGYASVAPVVAGRVMLKRTAVHEQNVVPGMATKLLSRLVHHVCLTFEETGKYLPHATNKLVMTGSPIRSEMVKALMADVERSDDPLEVLVTGGSLGARFLSEAVPEAVLNLPDEVKARLHVTHQARPEDVGLAGEGYEKAGVQATVAPFFDDFHKKIAAAHVVIARPGTSTLLEVSLAGRAAIYIPHEMADGHQVANGQVAAAHEAGVLLRQKDVEKSHHLSELLLKLLVEKDFREKYERGSAAFAQKDGARKFSDVILGTLS